VSERVEVIERLTIPEVWTYTPRRFEDQRGWFSETFNSSTLAEALQGVSFVQDNHSMSRAKGTLRGLHFQAPPHAQDKLVRVVRGAVLDVAVDLRRRAPSFGRWVSAVLDADSGRQMFVPKGFAHAFLTLEPETEVLYKVSAPYHREAERGVVWNDPDLGIDWGVAPADVVLVERDRMFPRLAELEAFF
jgi:dTDP-4-dehydrorhamnose 3,5-epimerase